MTALLPTKYVPIDHSLIGVSSVLLEWGSCGKIAYVDGVPAGYMLFAPPQYVPRSIAFPPSPVSANV